jgi:hypothetical protein
MKNRFQNLPFKWVNLQRYTMGSYPYPSNYMVRLALFTTLFLCFKTHSVDDSQYSPCNESDTRE